MTTDWPWAAFALGYAEHGTYPLPARACVHGRAIAESPHTGPAIGHLIVEAGRAEGQRAKRERSHKRLYSFHADALGTVLLPILKRVDAETVAHQVVEHAAAQTQTGASPVARRRTVAGVALGAIAAQVHAEDRAALTAVNTAGWSHATAYGQAEAQASPTKGGPPDPVKVAGLAVAALALIPSSEAEAASAGWTDLELQTTATGAALAAGDGAAVDQAVRAVKASLVDTGRAAAVYADQLHAAVNQAFLAHVQTAYATVQVNWVTNSGDPCTTCEDSEVRSPYAPTAVPTGPPAHPNCQCNLEVASARVPVTTGVTTT